MAHERFFLCIIFSVVIGVVPLWVVAQECPHVVTEFVIPLAHNFQQVCHEISEQFADCPRIIVLESDPLSRSLLSCDELVYLAAWTPDTPLTSDVLQRLCQRLRCKQTLSDLVLRIERVPIGVQIKATVIAHWTVGAITVCGMYFGKDTFRSSYLLDPGDFFDEGRHRHSIEKITQMLKDEGYRCAGIQEHLVRHDATREVDVTLVITKGTRSHVRQAAVVIEEAESVGARAINSLLSELNDLMESHLEGKKYTQTLLNSATKKVNAVLARKGFLDSKITLHEQLLPATCQIDVQLVVTLKNSKRLKFCGNHFFSSERLREELLALRQSLVLIPPSMLAEHLVALYRQQGFWDAAVQCHESLDRMFFAISEGPRARIAEIDIQGSSHEDIKKQSQLHFSKLLLRGFADARDIDEGNANLMRWYATQGFWDCTVAHKEYRPLDDPREYRLLITLHEGEQHFIDRVMIDGHDDLEEQPPFLRINARWRLVQQGALVPRIPFDAALVLEQRRWLLDHFRRQGYLYVSIHHDVRRVGDECHLIWKVDTPVGPTAFGRTIITGRTRVSRKVLTQEMCYSEGMVWSREALERTLERLRSRGVFDQVHLYPLDMATPGSAKDLRLHVVDDDPLEFKARVGFQQVGRYFDFHKGTTYKVGGSLVYKNPFCCEDLMRCDVDVTRFYRQVAAQYQRPWTGSLPLQTLYKLYSYKYVQPLYLGSRYPLYDVTQQGGLVSITAEPSRVTGGCTLGCELMRISGLSDAVARAINFSSRLVDKNLPYIFMEPTLFVDALDNKISPTAGASVLLSCKGMFPLKEGTFFIRMLVENCVFVPVDQLVVALRLRLGHIFYQDFPEIMPTERFYLGGAQSIRGYQTDLAPPLGFFEECGQRCYVPRGGKTVMSLNAELRIPISGKLGLVLFSDCGLLRETLCATVMDTLRTGGFVGASGFGLRYALPIGPLRFDIGWKWHKLFEQDCPFAWFLTLGQAF